MHFYRTPKPIELLQRAAITAFSRWVRPHDSSRETQAALAAAVRSVTADALVCTGDLCSTQSEEEFVAAAEFFAHCCDGRVGFVVPGNHDTRRRKGDTEVPQRAFEQYFHRWIPFANGRVFPTSLTLDFVTLVGLDQSPGSTLRSSGYTGEAQLGRLTAVLSGPQYYSQTIVLCEHYPWTRHDKTPFDRRTNRLIDLRETKAAVMGAANVPSVLLHGHVHQRCTHELVLDGRAIVCANSGASATAYHPRRLRRASFNVYTFTRESSGKTTLLIEPYFFDGRRFSRQASQVFALAR